MGSALVLIGVGLVALIVSGELFVRSAVSIAHRFRLSPLIIGLTVVAFGTSLPELTVSVQATLANQADIAVGNVVGSNIANMLLVLGAAALITPFTVRDGGVRRDSLVMIALSAFVVFLSFFEVLPRWIGWAMIASLVVYTLVQMRLGRSQDEAPDEPELAGGMKVAVPVAVISLAGLVFGADALVEGASNLARYMGVSEAVIGLTIVAVGTSLPELAISVIAAFRGHAAVAVGNAIGSNIFNVLMILGAAIAVGPLHFAPEIAQRDVWVMLGACTLVVGLIWSGGRLNRLEGLVALVLYFVYSAFLFYAAAPAA